MGTVSGIPSADDETAVDGDGADPPSRTCSTRPCWPTPERYSYVFSTTRRASTTSRQRGHPLAGRHLDIGHARINADFPRSRATKPTRRRGCPTTTRSCCCCASPRWRSPTCRSRSRPSSSSVIAGTRSSSAPWSRTPALTRRTSRRGLARRGEFLTSPSPHRPAGMRRTRHRRGRHHRRLQRRHAGQRRGSGVRTGRHRAGEPHRRNGDAGGRHHVADRRLVTSRMVEASASVEGSMTAVGHPRTLQRGAGRRFVGRRRRRSSIASRCPQAQLTCASSATAAAATCAVRKPGKPRRQPIRCALDPSRQQRNHHHRLAGGDWYVKLVGVRAANVSLRETTP